MKQRMTRKFAVWFMAVAMLTAIVPRGAAAASALAEGEYTVPLEVLKAASDEISAAGDYIARSARLVIDQGSIQAVLTLNNRSWWQTFKTQAAGSGSLSDVLVMSEDEANDTRVVMFEVQDAYQPVRAKIHIVVTGIPGFEYDNEYDIRLKFDVGGIPVAPDMPEVSPEPEKHAPAPEPAPVPDASEDPPAVTSPDTSAESAEKPESVQSTETAKTAEATEATEQQQAAAVENGDRAHDANTDESAPIIDKEIAVQTEVQPSGDVETKQADNANASGRTTIILLSVAALGVLVLLGFMLRARSANR